MNTLGKTAILILGLGLLLGRSASAQTPPSYSLSLGVLSPTDTDTRHRTGSILLLGEVRYALPAAPSASRTVLAGSAARISRAYEDSTIVSGTIGQVFSLTPRQSPFAARTAYVGAGAGLYGMDLQFIHAFARVGAYAEAGYNLSGPLFVNAQYRLVNRGSGASLAFGVRF